MSTFDLAGGADPDLISRPRRNRRTSAIRSMCRETKLESSQLIYPMFLHADPTDIPIESMPGQTRWSLDGLATEVKRVYELGIDKVVIFPKVDETLKTRTGDEAFNNDGLIPQAIRKIKDASPDTCVVTDVALDPYSSDGHDGIVSDAGEVLNDETVAVLCEQALSHARAGADIVAPSDMMDGRVGSIRAVLDQEGFSNTSIMSYTAKYASAFYGPFRDAADGAPVFGDRRSHQMDPANAREALREARLDIEQGADFLMVKPALAYLDIVRSIRDSFPALPLVAYNVSGEYAMLKAAVQAGWLDEKAVVMESLLSMKRAGADLVITYYAEEVAQWLRKTTP